MASARGVRSRSGRRSPGTAEHQTSRLRRLFLASVGQRELTMPKTTKRGTAKKSELPSTLKKSPAKAQRTFAKVHDAAAEQYGEGERAHRTAYDALKHSFEKVGDHWEQKAEKGPSDSRARSGGPNPKGTSGRRRRRQRVQGTSDGCCTAAGYLRPFHHDQDPARQRDQEGQPSGQQPHQVAVTSPPRPLPGEGRSPPTDFVLPATVGGSSCG